MKIKLEYPFSEDWRLGYLRINREGRRVVDLFNSNNDRTTISYARYLMSVSLKKYIPKKYEIDHIDNNKTNDSLENLQLLLPKDNLAKVPRTKTSLNNHGSLACYRYCKCAKCKLGKKLYNAGDLNGYYKLVRS